MNTTHSAAKTATKPTLLHLPNETRTQLEKIAAMEGRSISAMGSRLLQAGIDATVKTQKKTKHA